MFVVTGTYDQNGGKPSKIGQEIIKHLDCAGMNGGTMNDLINFNCKDQDLIWMPNIDNSEDKILPTIKQNNNKLLLVSSKRCIETKYNESDVVGHLLKNKSNLGIMIEKTDKYNFKLLDPLGNIYADTSDIEQLCVTLQKRVAFLKNVKRASSVKIDDKRDFHIEDTFVDIIKKYGNMFALFVNAINPNRFLGNAATRCSYGFPSCRQNDRIFVTRRNVEKRTLSNVDFVEIAGEGWKLGYYGDIKPSVDSPNQLMAFDHYSNVNYIIHGHVYVDGAKMTEEKHPCGSLDEIFEITKWYDRESTNFCINLRGHGCLIMAKDLDFFTGITLIGRPFPESE